MKENEEKENPHPSRMRGRGVEVSKTLFYPQRNNKNIAYFPYSKLTTVCFLSGQFTIDFLYTNRI